jgi:hypothetical protein
MRSLHVTLLLLLICGSALAQSTLPFGPTNIGREFWVSFPANWEYAAAKKYVRLYMTSSVRTRVAVYVGPKLLDSGYTVPNDLRTVDIDQLLAQVFVRDDATPTPPDSVYVNRAIHIVADDPIVVYGINRTTATSDGMMLLPAAALGHEYVVASARDVADGTIQRLPSQYMVIAPFDSTTVTLVNPMDSPNHKAGESFTVTMNRGDVFSSMSVGFHGDLSGALIRADKPVAVTAGENCTYLPDERYPSCDHICEMLFPVSAWGRYFKSVPYQGRTKGDLYRIFAGADGADIFINGVKYGTLAKKGGGSRCRIPGVSAATAGCDRFQFEQADHGGAVQQLKHVR